MKLMKHKHLQYLAQVQVINYIKCLQFLAIFALH